MVRFDPETEQAAKDKGVPPQVAELLPHQYLWKHEPLVWLSVGLEHVCGVTVQGRTFTYGSGMNGKLGHGVPTSFVIPKFISFSGEPTPVGDKVLSSHCGANFTLLRTNNGRVYSFGSGEFFQLGNGLDSDVSIPQLLKSIENRHIIMLATGAHHSLALTATGELLAWGLNSEGQCGIGHLEPVKAPTTITFSREVARKKHKTVGDLREREMIEKAKFVEKQKKLAAAKKDTEDFDPFAHQHLALASSGSSEDDFSSDNYEEWTKKIERQDLELKKRGIKRTPDAQKELEKKDRDIKRKWEIRVKRQTAITDLQRKEDAELNSKTKEKLKKKRLKLEAKEAARKAAKKQKRMAAPISKDTKRKHMLKDLPDSHDSISMSVFKSKDMMTVPLNFVHVQCGSLFSAALTEDGKLYMWGDNSCGQLGVGSTVNQKVPTLVLKLDKFHVVQVACGRKHTLALTDSGQVFAWGANNEGQLGLGHKQPVWSPTEVLELKGRQIALISCGMDHSVCLEGQLQTRKLEKRKFLTRAEMEREIKQRQKEEEAALKAKRKRGLTITNLERRDSDAVRRQVIEQHRADPSKLVKADTEVDTKSTDDQHQKQNKKQQQQQSQPQPQKPQQVQAVTLGKASVGK